MQRTAFLIDQLNRAIRGEAWHGPALQKLIEGIDEPQAKQHPLPKRHSIFELVVHITTWIDVVARRVGGETIDDAKVKEGCDPNTPWSHVVQELDRAHARLCDAVALRSDSDLAKPVPGARRTIESEILGALQHTVYHSGQIAILKTHES